MKKNILLIVSLMLVLILSGCAVSEETVDSFITSLESKNTISPEIKSQYPKVSGAETFKGKLLQVLEDESDFSKTANLVANLESLGYEDDDVRDAFRAGFQAYRASLDDADRAGLRLYLRNIEPLKTCSYYCDEYDCYPFTEWMDRVLDQGQKVIFKDGEGGYYDTRKSDDQHYWYDPLAKQKVSRGSAGTYEYSDEHVFLGDFMLRVEMKIFYGTKLGDYGNEVKSQLYYQGKALSWDDRSISDFLRFANEGETYSLNDYFVVIGPGVIAFDPVPDPLKFDYRSMKKSEAAEAEIYRYASGLFDSGDYQSAFKAYMASVTDESMAQAQESLYRFGLALYTQERYEDVSRLFASFEYKDSGEYALQALQHTVRSYEPGDTVVMGNYEQDNDESNGKEPVDWIIMEKEENRALLLSLNTLDMQPFNTRNEDVDWASCSLRKWLNDDFLNDAFSEQIQAGILTTLVCPDQKGPNETLMTYDDWEPAEDRIFLISLHDAAAYFQYTADAIAEATDYCLSKARAWASDDEHGAYVAYWTRTSYRTKDNTHEYARKCGIGEKDPSALNGVRPALWLDLRLAE